MTNDVDAAQVINIDIDDCGGEEIKNSPKVDDVTLECSLMLLQSMNLVASCSLNQKTLISECDLSCCNPSKVLRSNQ